MKAHPLDHAPVRKVYRNGRFVFRYLDEILFGPAHEREQDWGVGVILAMAVTILFFAGLPR